MGDNSSHQNRNVGSNMVAGLVLGLNEIVAEISLAILIFSGVLAPYLPTAISFLIIGSILAMLITAYTSSFKGMLSPCEDIPAAILAVMAAGIATSLDGQASSDEIFITVVAAILITTLLTGVVFISLGIFKVGSLFRFLPYPVIGGFLAGTGYLLATGGLGVMIELPRSMAEMMGLLSGSALTFWLPGVLFGVTLYIVLNRWSHFLVFPVTVAAAALIFYAVALGFGSGPAALESAGYLLGRFPEGQSSIPFLPTLIANSFSSIQWGAITAQVGNIFAIVVLSTVALLLNSSGIELFVKEDLDLNQELVAAGLSTLGSGAAGGIVAYPAVGFTSLGYSLGGRGRSLAFITSAISLIILMFGTPILALIPKFIFGGLLIFLGLEMLVEWLVHSRHRFSTVEFVILLAILLTIATFGFLEGVILGLLLAVGVFIYSYSRVSVVKHVLTGRELGARVTRHPQLRETLADLSDNITIFQLQGYLFFGTAHSLLQQIRDRISVGQTDYLVLDFQRVSGLDSTAVLIFNKLLQLIDDSDVALVFAPPPPVGRSRSGMAILFDELAQRQDDQVHLFPSLDRGLEWCEDQLLIAAGCDISDEPHPLNEFFGPLLPDGFDFDKLLHQFERLEVEPGFYLMRQGDEATAMYFIESGQVTAQLEPADEEPVRLETMRGGRIVGEIGFFLDQPRTAAVVADEPTTLYRLSAANLTSMKAEDPEAAHVLQEIFLRLVSERLTHLITTVEALKR